MPYTGTKSKKFVSKMSFVSRTEATLPNLRFFFKKNPGYEVGTRGLFHHSLIYQKRNSNSFLKLKNCVGNEEDRSTQSKSTSQKKFETGQLACVP